MTCIMRKSSRKILNARAMQQNFRLESTRCLTVLCWTSHLLFSVSVKLWLLTYLKKNKKKTDFAPVVGLKLNAVSYAAVRWHK